MFSNFTIVGNGNSPVQELQNSVLGCLNEIICSLDKSIFHVAIKVPLTMALWTLQAMQKIHLTISAVLYNFLTKPSDMFY